MKKPTQPVLILLPGEPDEFMSFECSECGQLFLTDSEYTDWDLMEDFGRHLHAMHKGQYSLPISYEIRWRSRSDYARLPDYSLTIETRR